MARRIVPHAPAAALAPAILAMGEIAVDETTGALRVGNGAKAGGNTFSSDIAQAAAVDGKFLEYSANGVMAARYKRAAARAFERTTGAKLDQIVDLRDFARSDLGYNGDQQQAWKDALAEVQRLGGGTLKVGPGIYQASLLDLVTQQGVPIRVKGEGMGVTVFAKTISDAAPAVQLRLNDGGLESYSLLEDLTINNAFRGRNGTGLKLDGIAGFKLVRVEIYGFTVGVDVVGSLIFSADGCKVDGNGTGWRFRRKTNGVYCNLITIRDGRCNGNDLAMDIDESCGLCLEHVDMEGNGIAGNPATGAVRIGPGMGNEMGFSFVSIEHCWIEQNNGYGIRCDSSPACIINISRCLFVANENGQDVRITGTRQVNIRECLAPSPVSLWTIQAVDSNISGGLLSQLVDTSTNQFHNVETGSFRRSMAMTSFRVAHDVANPTANDMLVGGDGKIGVTGNNADSGFYKYGARKVYFAGAGGIKIQYNSTGVGFNGVEPVAKQPVGGALDTATATTAQIATEVNLLRTALITNGLGQAS